MASPFLLQLCLYSLCHFAAAHWIGRPDKCHHSTSCGQLGDLGYPFSNNSGPGCSMHQIKCGNSVPKLCGTSAKEPSYIVKDISYYSNLLRLKDGDFIASLETHQCDYERNFTLPSSRLLSFQRRTPLVTFLKCEKSTPFPPGISFFPSYPHCERHNLYYPSPDELNENGLKSMLISSNKCHVFEFPLDQPPREDRQEEEDDLVSLLRNGFLLEYDTTPNCSDCLAGKRQCQGNALQEFRCLYPPASPPPASPGPPTASPGHKNNGRLLAVSIAGPAAGIILCVVCYFLCSGRSKRLLDSSLVRLRSRSVGSNGDVEKCGSSALQTHVFSYQELEQATNNFDPSKELGSGGYGLVYHGKLRDGRCVAIKRLYEQSCRRVEQFMNEVEILSQLCHPNLVSLYGCTSRHSRELLLVYEFIDNGTLADHLHGDQDDKGALTWPIRMSIAIETAEALAYLHAVEPPIIHRDIKSTNILLDSNFRVKVADFGLSRFFPMGASHISTAPQGTPGYVDPDYHKYFQLTDKSDVYSFGVVLIELVSSMKAVDVFRHRQDINLANLAVNKIQNGALHELVDPTLGFETNRSVKMTVTLVAELAFRCLQEEKEVRPSMEEAVEILKGIESEVLAVKMASN